MENSLSATAASHRGKNFVYKGGNGNDSQPYAPCDVIYASVDPSVKEIGKCAFSFCLQLKSISIPEGVEIIGEKAFLGCSEIETIDLPSTLKGIEKAAFQGCFNLVSVKFNEGLEIVEEGAFRECSKLNAIDLPSSLKQIEIGAFKFCYNMVSVMSKEGLEIIGEDAFTSCFKLNTIDLPSSLKQIEKGAFRYCDNLFSLEFKKGLEVIGEDAFGFCSKLNTVDLPSTLKMIEKGAFICCENLVSVTFKEGLEIIEEGAFDRCSKLETISLPSTLKVVEKEAFGQCNNLESVKVEEGLQIIGEEAFKYCFKLNTIDLPSTLKTIKNGAFLGCKNLTSVKLKEGLEMIGLCAFSSCSKLKEIYLPFTLKKIEERSFYNCKILKMIEIREGAERLGSRVFAGCNNIDTVILPSSLIEIGDAFVGCKILSNVKFQPDVFEARKEPIQKNTILHQLLDYKYSLLFITSFLMCCPTAISERNTLGQTPLHLCITNQSGIEITKFVYNLWPGALNQRNEIGKTPLDYWEEMGKDPQLGKLFSTEQSLAKIAPCSAFFLNDGKWIPFDTPELLRCQHIMLEIPESDDEILGLVQYSGETLRTYFHEQLYTRELLFGKLLDEFALLIEFDDKLVIQRAAAVQALCGKDYLSKCLKRHVDFGAFSSSALWYQQEILKLVLRVYHEDQARDTESGGVALYGPSAINDAKNGQHSLENVAKPVPNHRKKSFMALLNWLVDELGVDAYTFEGPVLKPLQSLFNKIYIRRGQTKVSIIGDMTRATLHIKKAVDVVNIIARIKKFFSHIQNFVSPDAVGVEEFMNQVFKMKKVPGTEIIPYRLKVNSSQEGKGLPLLYNLNFFDMVPEYHRVGTTEMFVAFELQIGLESEIQSNRADHVAYERRRILKYQSLLKDYIEATDNGNHSSEEILLPPSAIGVNRTKNDQDFKIMTAILEGNFCHGQLRALEDVELCGEGKHRDKPDRLCLNNKRLNRLIKEGHVCILDKVSSLDPSLQYCVKSLLIHWNSSNLNWILSSLYIGLFAHVGPYMVNVASRCITKFESESDVYIVKPQVNFETLERISPLPIGCTTVLLICWGNTHPTPKYFQNPTILQEQSLKNENYLKSASEIYNGMKLVLQRYKKMECLQQ